MSHPLRFESKKGRICVAWVWNREGTEKLVNGKQHSVWFVTTGMKGLPQNVLLNFRLEFPKSDLTIYLPSGISEIFRQMVSTPSLPFSHAWNICILEKQATKVILVGWFGKCQSIIKVGGRRFVEGLYQALFSFRLARRNVILKAKRK